ncbi:MAG TPA: hypothetical protein VIZ90_04185, partial [Rhizobiaceae bacterium]
MKSLIRKAILASTFMTIAPVLAFAADPSEPLQERYAVSGNVAIWGQYVTPASYGSQEEYDDDYDYYVCDGSGNFCDES